MAENAEKEWNLLKKKLADKKQSFEQANVVWMEAMESQQKCMDAYSSAQKQYLDGISGTLAEKLIPGEPCPVCGSREHPKPARLSQKKVTEKELDTLNKKLNACTKAVSRNAELRRNAEAVYQNLQQEAGKAEQNMIALQTAYEELLGQKISGIENAMQLKEEELVGMNRIAVTSGSSTPTELTAQVLDVLNRYAKEGIFSLPFSLPVLF